MNREPEAAENCSGREERPEVPSLRRLDMTGTLTYNRRGLEAMGTAREVAEEHDLQLLSRTATLKSTLHVLAAKEMAHDHSRQDWEILSGMAAVQVCLVSGVR